MFPVGDDNPTIRTPVMTYAILGLIFASWVFVQGMGADQLALVTSVCNLGLVPAELTHLRPLGYAVPLDARGTLACVVDNEPINRLTPLTSMFLHGATWGGHPVSAAVALANIEVFESHGLLGNVKRNEDWLGEQLRELMSRHEIIGDVRGTGYFWAMELVADRENKIMFDDEQAERLLRGFLSHRLLELGLICRADDRDEPVIQISPPLIADRTVLGEMVDILDQVMGEATKHLQDPGDPDRGPHTNEAVAL